MKERCDVVRGMVQKHDPEQLTPELRLVLGTHFVTCPHCDEWLAKNAIGKLSDDDKAMIDAMFKSDIEELSNPPPL